MSGHSGNTLTAPKFKDGEQLRTCGRDVLSFATETKVANRPTVDILLEAKGLTKVEPRELVKNWVSVFNRANADEMATFYSEDAVNHQVVRDPLIGREAIREMFAREFNRATMVCEIENIFQDGEWAMLEWKDPNGLRGCGFFHVINDQIVFQRGYFNELSFLRQQGLPLPTE